LISDDMDVFIAYPELEVAKTASQSMVNNCKSIFLLLTLDVYSVYP